LLRVFKIREYFGKIYSIHLYIRFVKKNKNGLNIKGLPCFDFSFKVVSNRLQTFF